MTFNNKISPKTTYFQRSIKLSVFTLLMVTHMEIILIHGYLGGNSEKERMHLCEVFIYFGNILLCKSNEMFLIDRCF